MRIIIDYPDDMPPCEAIARVDSIVSLGGAIYGNYESRSCSAVVFPELKVEVIDRPKKKGSQSDSFLIRRTG
jgi:hypothetical protein